MFCRSTIFLVTAVSGALLATAPAVAQNANISSLHDALHLTAAEEPAWRAYVSAVTPDPSSDSRRRSAAMMAPTLTTPRRVDLMNAEMDEDMKTLRRQGEAVKAFYATLTPEQQRTFDHQTMQGGSGSQSAPPSGRPLRQPSSGAMAPPSGQP